LGILHLRPFSSLRKSSGTNRERESLGGTATNNYPFIILLQEATGEEATSLTQQARETGEELGQTTGSVFENVATFFGNIAAYLVSVEFIGNLVAAVVVVTLAILFYKLAMRLIPRILQWHMPEPTSAPNYHRAQARVKRRSTAITLVRNVLRYMIFAIVALFIVSIFLRDALPTVAGASILVAVLGFGAQNLVRDIIAGFFILFEGQYGVGDFIWIESAQAAGIVEEFGLRTTTLRTPSGELVYIPNGSITSVTKYGSGQQNYTISVQLNNDESVDRVLEELDGHEGAELYLTPPRLMKRDETPEGNIRLQLLAGVLPSTGWLVEENLIESIKAAAGEEGLAAEPLVYKVDHQSVSQIRNFVPPISKLWSRLLPARTGTARGQKPSSKCYPELKLWPRYTL
jgi:moderate conductance mechanosensitive channel